MTIKNLDAAAKERIAVSFPELLDATLKEYMAYMKTPTAEEKTLTFGKKQASAKAAAGHLILILKLLKQVGIDPTDVVKKEDLSKILLLAKQEFESHLMVENIDFNDLDDDD